MLYLVPTPVGNLKDITLRAIETLQEVDLILCEDTRTSSKLLQHYQIQRPLSPFHQHNEHKVVPHLVEQLSAGKKIALITDAGTPGISDPAFLLVRAAVQAGIQVQTLPGATAFVPALVSSGLPAHSFYFEGFLPVKKGRKTRLAALAVLPVTFILYESPLRLPRTIADLIEHCGGDRKASVSREISKMFEEHIRGSLLELEAHFKQHPPRGEIVIVIEGIEE